MTDEELIRLVQEKAPEELSFDEIQAIRERLPALSELQVELMGQLQMESYLAQALGRVQVSVDKIVAAGVTERPGQRTAALLGWIFCIAVGLFVLSVLIMVTMQAPKPLEPRNELDVMRRGGEKERGNSQEGLAERDSGTQSSLPVASADTTSEPGVESPDGGAAPGPQTGEARTTPAPTGQVSDVGLGGAVFPELAPDSAQRRTADDTAFEGVAAAGRGLTQNELKRWFTGVAGHQHRFLEMNRGDTVTAGFEGLVRLKAAWPADGVMRVAPFDNPGFVIYFWNAEQGIALHSYLHPRPTWAAYRTRRNAQEPRPTAYALVATDDDRYERTGAGPIEIRHQDGALVVSRGDVRLITAPLVSPPTEVYFDRRAWLRTFAMYRGEPLPDPREAPAANVLASHKPAALEWSSKLPAGATLSRRGEESIWLETQKASEPGWAAFKLPETAPCEMILQVEGADPGTGIFLGDDAGQPLCLFGFFKEHRTGWTTFGPLRPGEQRFVSAGDVNLQPVPFSGEQQWLRIVVASGCVKCWTSGDGLHWSQAFDPTRPVHGHCAQIGLYCQRTDTPRVIGLKLLEVRERAEFSALAPRNLRALVPQHVLRSDGDIVTWLTRVLDSQPANVDARIWRQVCAVQTLAHGPSAALGNRLLDSLYADLTTTEMPLEKRLNLLNQVAELYDAWEFQECYKLTQLYEGLGRRLIRERNPQPYSQAGKALLTSPLWSSARFEAMPESLVKAELLEMVYADNWAGVRDLSRQLRFWNETSLPGAPWPDHRKRIKNVVDWAEAYAARLLPGVQRGEGATPIPAAWRHPLVVELNKEGFNTLAEVQVALSEEAFGDACQIISSAKPQLALGLLPDSRDSRLLVSFPQAVSGSMRDYPALRRTMVEQYARLGRLRVQQSIAESNLVNVRAATVQFFGTEAAAEAHLWLGDRALASGDFGRALGEFDAGVRSAVPGQLESLSARMRLAGALLGREQSTPPVTPVALGSQTFSPPEFERLVTEMKARVQSGIEPVAAFSPVDSAAAACPRPLQYETVVRSRLAGDVGLNPNHVPHPSDVDWVAKQLAWTVSGNVVYLNNRFQVSAIDATTGAVKWSTPLGADQGSAHDWPLVPMRPVLAGDRVFVRRLSKSGPELASLDSATGKVHWNVRPPEQVASDPMFVQDELVAFTVNSTQPGMLQLQLTTFNPLTGDVVGQRPVVQLLDGWNRQVPCQAVTVGGRIVAAVGGTVLCCDSRGQPLWVRRQTWIPRSQNPASQELQRSAPVVAQGRVLIVQPGVLSVECISVDTGRRIWQRSMPDLKRILGVSGQRAILETAQGLDAVSLENGENAWHHEAGPLLEAQICAATGELLYVRREQVSPELWRPNLVWFDTVKGREVAVWPLEQLADKEPQVGPMIPLENRLWSFFGRGTRDAGRDLVELVLREAPPYPGRTGPTPLELWSDAGTDDRVRQAASVVMPGWSCMRAVVDGKAGLRAESPGQKAFCTTLATREKPVVFAREVQLPAGGQPKLVVQVGHEPAERWKLGIQIGGRSLETHIVDATSSSNGWNEWTIDLTPYAGQNVWLIAEQQVESKTALGHWKRLDVVY